MKLRDFFRSKGASSLSSANIVIGDSNDTPTDVAVTGDVTISNAGVTTIGAGKVTEAMQVLAANTTNNVSTTKHGYVPVLPNDATKYFDGSGAYSVPAGGGASFTGLGTIPGGRLTTESGVAVSTSDRTAQATLYYAIDRHTQVSTYSGTAWVMKTFAEIPLSLATAVGGSAIASGSNYDVFLNSAADTLSLSAAWTNDTTRANALGTQDGVLVLGSDHTKLYLGTIRGSASGQTTDSGGGGTTQVGGKRFVWNMYNRHSRPITVIDTTDSWTYVNGTIRQADGAAGNKVEVVIGLAEDLIALTVRASVVIAGNSTRAAKVGVGVNSTTAFNSVGIRSESYNSGASILYTQCHEDYRAIPALGYSYFAWIEQGADGSNSAFVGDDAANGTQSGMTGSSVS